MAWLNLDEDLGELFGEFTSRADAMVAALDVQRARRRAYQTLWSREKRARMTAEERERRRARNRAYDASRDRRVPDAERAQRKAARDAATRARQQTSEWLENHRAKVRERVRRLRARRKGV